jgi:hypothetical protein
MNYPRSELPPADFVAFLAQRSGLSQEAAECRLERWFGEYHASSKQRAADSRFASSHSQAG